MRNFKRKLRECFERFGQLATIPLLLVVIVGFFVIRFGGVGQIENLIPAATGVVFGLVALIVELIQKVDRFRRNLNKRMETLTENTTGEIATLTSKVDNLSTSLGGEPMSLESCQRDFLDILKTIEPREHVVINHLGLNMEQAWRRMRDAVLDSTSLSDVDLNILVLASDSSALHEDCPVIVRNWCAAVPTFLDELNEFASVIEPRLEAENRIVTITVKEYARLPKIHGFACMQPFKVRYFSLCRWYGNDSTRFDWGEDRYHKALGDTQSWALRDMAQTFEGEFEHLWNTQSSDALNLRLGAASSSISPTIP